MPQQRLFFLNNSFVHKQAEELANRVKSENTEDAQITASGASGSCTTTGVTYTPPASFADIPAGDSKITLSGAAQMDTTSQTGCQGARSLSEIVLFLGSTIGNLDIDEAIAMLANLRAALKPGDALFLGADLRKPKPILESDVTHVLDKDGNEIAVFKHFETYIWLNPADIPQVMKDAVVSAEDKHFYDHGGVDVGATLRALWDDLRREGFIDDRAPT